MQKHFLSLRILINFVVVGVFAVNIASSAIADSLELEFQVKAACLFNFARYIKWPEEAFSDANSSFKICVVGPNPFGAIFSNIGDKRVQDRPAEFLSIPALNNIETNQLEQCQIIYTRSQNSEVNETVAQLASGRPILMVSDDSNGPGTMHFVVRQGKVRFRIDYDDARTRGLSVSANLLRLALHLDPREG